MDLCVKKHNGLLKPVRDQDCRWLDKADNDEYFIGKVKRMKKRNGAFFAKWWAMVDYAFDLFEPEVVPGKYGTPEKNLERFRKDLTILAGHHTATFKITGEMVLEAKSIAWNNMDEEEFKQFYTATFNAISKYIFKNYSAEQIKEIEKVLWGF